MPRIFHGQILYQLSNTDEIFSLCPPTQALLKARRLEDSKDYVIIEELEFDPLDDDKSQPHHRHAYHRVAQESTGGHHSHGHHHHSHHHRVNQVPTVLTKKRIIADDEILYLVQSNWRSKGLFRMMKRVQAQQLIGASGTLITTTATASASTAAVASVTSESGSSRYSAQASSGSASVMKKSSNLLSTFDFASTSTTASEAEGASFSGKVSSVTMQPSTSCNVQVSSSGTSSGVNSSPRRIRPATRSLLKWAASATGSFRRMSRMSSFSSSRGTRERSASTDRDSSTGKSDSFDSPNELTY